MTKQVQLRRGTSAEHAVFTGAEGELTIDTTLDIAIVHDGSKVGGYPLVGAAATQQIVNKTGVGIGTSTLTKELQVIGDADVYGQITTKGLTVQYEDPTVKSGIISATTNNVITGVSTENVRVGYAVSGTYISSESIVVEVGINTVFLSEITEDLTTSSTGKFLQNNGSTIVGIDTISTGVQIGYAVSSFGNLLINTTVIDISSDNNGTIELSQPSLGTLGITTRTGTINDFGSSLITGISTENLLIGDIVENEFITEENATITSIGNNELEISIGVESTGNLDFTFSREVNFIFINPTINITDLIFYDLNQGQINVDVLNSNNTYIEDLTANRVAISSEFVENSQVVNQNVENSQVVNQNVENSQVVNQNVENSQVVNQNVGIQTVDISNVSTSFIDNLGVSTSLVDNLYGNVGIITDLTSDNFNADISNINELSVEDIFITNGISSGILTSTNIDVDYIGITSGIATDFSVDNLYGNVGIITDLTSDNFNADISNINELSVNNILIENGVSTGVITSTNIDVDYIGITSGIATDFSVDNLYSNNLYYSVGIGTTSLLKNALIDELSANIGIITSLNVTGVVTSGNVIIGSNIPYDVVTSSGTILPISTFISGINTSGIQVGQFVVNEFVLPSTTVVSIGSSEVIISQPTTNEEELTVSFIFESRGTTDLYVNADSRISGILTVGNDITIDGNDNTLSGISTISSSDILVSNITETRSLNVTEDARISGILTVGENSVSVNGNTSSIHGISTVYSQSGIITSIVGSESSYENVNVSDVLTFSGINSETNLNNSVTFKLSSSGIATNYNLTLPPNRGKDGMTLTVDAFGNLGFSTNPGGLYENRIYVSSVNGNDTDDGKTKPVKSIKRAAQLASFESFVLPENRFLDAANLLNSNKEFIKTEVVGFITSTYPSITENPDWDRSICARDVGYIVDALVYDLTYNGNSQSVGAGISYYIGVGNTETYVDGEKEETIAGFQYIYEMSKFIINNIEITTDNLGIYQISVGAGQTVFQTFDNTLLYDEQCNPVGYSSACCANVQSTIVNLVGIVTTIIGVGTESAPEIVLPTSKSNPVAIIVEAGEYVEDNPIILFEDIAVLGDNLRNTIIRPLNAGKDLFRVRNGCYLTGFAMKDYVDPAGVPQYTFDYAVAFDDPIDSTTDRTGYAIKTNKPIITRSPYIQNCSLLSFLGANGMKVDGSKIATPNTSFIPEESETPVEGEQPEFGKSMVANAFTMVSFGGIGWRVFNDGYSQVVSCFQIFCKYGSLAQSGGYLSITNSATNFGKYALRATGFDKRSYAFDRGRISSTGTSGGLATLKVVGLGRSDQDLYVLRFFDDTLTDRTVNFKPLVTTLEIDGNINVDIDANTIVFAGHPFINGDSVIYLGDDDAVPPRIIGGLVPDTQYWIGYIDASKFNLYEDETLTTIVDLTSTSTGIHTFQKNVQEFFAKDVLEAHNFYQRIGIASTSSDINFVSGREITQQVVGGTAIGIAYTYDSSTRELIVSIEPFDGVRRNFQITNGTTNLTIDDHSNTPIAIAVTSVTGLSTYWTSNFTVESTDAGTNIIGISQLPETYRCHFHRPSIINSSSHTWEFSGSGTDYNALPQNGGKSDPKSEQVSELGGRVYTSGTNELGDFKIGTFITAFNRTGNIVFNNTVTIGTLDSIRLSLSGGTAITEFSTDVQLGDNELGGPLHSRVSTQLAVRSFLNNRLGAFIDKNVSTNAVPGAVVQLNSIGQINADLIPPKVTNFFRAADDGGRTQLVNYIPATNLNSGDTVVEPTNAYVLINDVIGQYLVLDNSTIYDFQNDDVVFGTVSQGGAVGLVTSPPKSGINTTVLSFPNVGYGTTGLVRGVPLTLKDLNGGSGYSSAGIYTGVRLDAASGIGTGITATIVVSIAGTISQVAINTGGYKFSTDDILTLNDANVIGGRSGGSNFTVKVGSVETRLYLKLTNNQKFLGSVTLPDYIQDRKAVSIGTNVGIASTVTFIPTDLGVGGAIDFVNDRIVIGENFFEDGDPVVYSNGGGQTLATLVNTNTYYVKRVGISSIELYSTYALSAKIPFTASGTGNHTLTRLGINTSTDQITFKNHGYSNGDPIRVSIGSESTVLPAGISTGAFYFVGSVTVNSFTLHNTRTDSLLSSNGLLFNTIDISSTGSGIVTFTKQNVTYTSTVNTSSSDIDNWALLASNDIDANNIISGTVNPSRLGDGTANTETFLRGDSSWQKVVTSIGIGVTEPIAVTFTSADFAPGGIGINTYYGRVNIALNRVLPTLDAYSTLGVARFKNSTFSIGSDGQIQIKNAAGGGDVDAVTLSGNNAAYYLDVLNHTGTIPITRGGTGLSALPSNGAFLVGNGSAYTLTTTPTFIGDATFSGGAGAVTLSANSDITLTNGSTWSGNINGKIQYFNNSLYLTYGTSLILRTGATDLVTISSAGVISGLRFVSSVATGTSPLTVTSTTKVANLNADLLDDLDTSSSNQTSASVVVRNNIGGFAAGIITATNFYGDGSNITNLNASELSSGTIPGVRGVVAGSTSNSFVTYNGTSQLTGGWDGGTTNPSQTTRLNYNGNLYSTRFLAGTNGTVSVPAISFAGSTNTGLYQSSGSLNVSTNGTLSATFDTANGLTVFGRLRTSGNITSTSWTTSGISFDSASATYTNSNGSGTIAEQVANSFNTPTFASTNAVTLTSASTVFIGGAPISGTNTTITNAYALRVNTGNSLFGGNVFVNGGTIESTSATFTIRSTSTAASTMNLMTAATTSGITKTINLGTGGVTGSITNVNIAPLDSLGTTTVGNNLTVRGRLQTSSNTTLASWTTAGISFNSSAATFTNSNGTGTISTQVANSFNTPTFASTNAVTLTNAANLYVSAAPVASTNTTITDSWSVFVAGGESRFDGAMSLTGGVSPRRGPIISLATLVGGSGYTDGTYSDIALTGGRGSLAYANITVAGGVVTSVVLVREGSYYQIGDVLSATPVVGGFSNGTGSGFTINVSNVRTVGLQMFGNPSRIRLGSSNTVVSNGTELGSILFNCQDATIGGRGDKVRLVAVAEGTSGGGRLEIFTSVNAGEPTLCATFAGNNNFTVNGSITETSDSKLKTNITTLKNSLDKVLNLRGVEFDRIDNGEHRIGLIAQEVEQIIPEVVSESKDGIKSVSYGNIVSLLIEAIKEQNSTINNLKNEINNLKNTINK
jgi:hypothetical protein